MQKRILGRTGLEVTELCFGALPMGPLQKNMDVAACAEVTAAALRQGINFVDTAQMYRTYEPIRLAMEATGIRPIIASKSAEKTYGGMKAAVEEALEQLGIDTIDIFLLHAARDGEKTFEIYADALRCLLDMKAAGKIRAVGTSTHHPKVVDIAAGMDEIDIVFPLINKNGRGVLDGTKEQMAAAIARAAAAGKGIYLMKVLAGGSLVGEYDACMRYARGLEGYAAIALGMVSVPEVEFNVRYFRGEAAGDAPAELQGAKRFQVFSALCKRCGLCIQTCPNRAITAADDGTALIDDDKCITCGYCTSACPEFAIRMI